MNAGYSLEHASAALYAVKSSNIVVPARAETAKCGARLADM